MPSAPSTSKLNRCKSSSSSAEIQAFALIVGCPKVPLGKLKFKMQIPDSTGGFLRPRRSWSYSMCLFPLIPQFSPGSAQRSFCSRKVMNKDLRASPGGWGTEGSKAPEAAALCSRTFPAAWQHLRQLSKLLKWSVSSDLFICGDISSLEIGHQVQRWIFSSTRVINSHQQRPWFTHNLIPFPLLSQ